MLSKSQFIRGRQCHKSLWLYRNRPALRDEISRSKQALFDSGIDVGDLARRLFPGGVLVPFEGLSFAEQVRLTRQAIDDGVRTIYEATFIHQDIFVKVDILHRGRRGWELYEVKSSTGCKEVYLDDIALQHYVVTGAGVPVVRDSLVHINTQYVRQGEIDVKELFAILPVTEQVLEKQGAVKKELNLQKAVLAGGEPVIDIGPHCDDPYGCDFRGYCWQHVPEPSVFSLRDRGKPDAFAFYRQGVIRLEDVPFDDLSWRQQLQVNGTLRQKNHVDHAAVGAFLERLRYPLSFLDFETTYLTPVPLFDHTKPFQQVPFQFSLHVQKRRQGKIYHHAFLAEKTKDPQKALLDTLLESLPEKGSILTWNAAFEIRCLRDLAQRFPRKKKALEEIIARIVDLMAPFFRKEIYHWQFEGSYSIKNVLPSLVPELSYEQMEIGDGGTASAEWARMLSLSDEEEIARIRRNLLEYCELDTMGMVRILGKLKELAVGGDL